MGHGKRHSSEKKLKAVWELAGDAMVFLDADGLLDCNDAALRLFGIDSHENAIGLPLHSFAPPTPGQAKQIGRQRMSLPTGGKRSSRRVRSVSTGDSRTRMAGRSYST